MAKVYVFMANGFEDVEALIPIDVLRRGGVDVITVSTTEDLICQVVCPAPATCLSTRVSVRH